MTLVPSARAKLTLRIGPGDDADAARDALVAHLTSHAPWGAEVTVTPAGRSQPFAADTTGPAYAAARRPSPRRGEPHRSRSASAAPSASSAPFAQAFPDAEILITGVEDPDTRAHGANESLHLADFERACLAEALLLVRLAQGA